MGLVLGCLAVGVSSVMAATGARATMTNASVGPCNASYCHVYMSFGITSGNEAIFIPKASGLALATTSTPFNPASVLAATANTTNVVPGDSATAYFMPAGAYRIFGYSGKLYRSGSATGLHTLRITQINYTTLFTRANRAITTGLDNLVVAKVF